MTDYTTSTSPKRRVFGDTVDSAILVEGAVDCLGAIASPSSVAIIYPEPMFLSRGSDGVVGCSTVPFHLCSSTPKSCDREDAAVRTALASRRCARQTALNGPSSRRSASCPAAPHGAHRDGVSEPMVPLRDLERSDRERIRFEKMYLHQKDLYTEMAVRQEVTYHVLQEKIVEVVGLSTRSEVRKNYIHQLKRDMEGSRTRVMAMQNTALADKRAKAVVEAQLQLVMEEKKQLEDRIVGLESLVSDLTPAHDGRAMEYVSLLRGAYGGIGRLTRVRGRRRDLFEDLSTHQDLLVDALEAVLESHKRLQKEQVAEVAETLQGAEAPQGAILQLMDVLEEAERRIRMLEVGRARETDGKPSTPSERSASATSSGVELLSAGGLASNTSPLPEADCKQLSSSLATLLTSRCNRVKPPPTAVGYESLAKENGKTKDADAEDVLKELSENNTNADSSVTLKEMAPFLRLKGECETRPRHPRGHREHHLGGG